MKDRWAFGITIGVTILIVGGLLLFDMFSATIFFIMLLFSVLYLARYFYIRYQFEEQKKKEKEFFGRRQKFDYCWRRVNEILRQMDGGQGIRWDSGSDVGSSFTTYNNGVTSKRFRSFKAFQEETLNPVIIIYDIDEDDIVRIVQSPNPEELNDNFYGFKPFQGMGGVFNPYGQPDDDMMEQPYNGGYKSRYNRSPTNINIGSGYEPKYNKPRLEPDDEAVNNALDKLK